MKYLVTRLFEGDCEGTVDLYDSLDSALRSVKEKCQSPYYADKYRIYSLSSPLTVRYLDNKIFID